MSTSRAPDFWCGGRVEFVDGQRAGGEDLGPAVEGARLVFGHAEHLREDADRQRKGERLDQVDLVEIGHGVEEVEPVRTHFEQAIGSRGRIEGDEELIGDGVALMGAAKFPARVKCVLMPWKAYQAALLETRALRG